MKVIFENNQKWFLCILGIGIFLRGFFLSQSMRYDEAVTYLDYASGNIHALLNYSQPNNHVFNTILIKLSTSIWGNNPAAIRLPAFLAGIASIALVYIAGILLINKKAGLLGALVASVFPFLVLYSTNARGYSFIVLFTILLVILGIRFIRKLSFVDAFFISVISALGLLSIPTMLFPIGGIYLWIFCLLLIKKISFKDIFNKYILHIGLMTVFFTTILYTPVIIITNGIKPIIANQYVTPQPFNYFMQQLPDFLLRTNGNLLGFIPKIINILGFLLILAGLYSSYKKNDWATFLLLPLILLGSAVVLFVQHKIPFDRTFIFIIPITLLVADAGFTFISERYLSKIRTPIMMILIIASAFFSMSLASNNLIAQFPTGHFEEASMFAKYLQSVMKSGDEVVAKTPADWPVYYYLSYYGVTDYTRHSIVTFDKNKYDPANPDKTIYFIVMKSKYTISDITDVPVEKILDFDNGQLYRMVDNNN